MGTLAIIGGTGLNAMEGVTVCSEVVVDTPYGAPSSALGRLQLPLPAWAEAGQPQQSCYFLPRHGRPHTIPPHRINYRANLWALQQAGVTAVIAVNAVGGIGPRMTTGSLAIPEDLIDYTWGREHTYYDGSGYGGGEPLLDHVDFTRPYSEALRQRLLVAAQQADVDVVDGGVYAATQGPRLESSAEVRRLARDGCDLVGMTGMPEAALARELGLAYASVCLVVNPAAGEGEGEITMADIQRVLAEGMGRVHCLLSAAVYS